MSYEISSVRRNNLGKILLILAVVWYCQTTPLLVAQDSIPRSRFDAAMKLMSSGQLDSAYFQIQDLKKDAPESAELLWAAGAPACPDPYNYFC